MMISRNWAFLLYCLFLCAVHTFAQPGGSSFGGLYLMKKAGDDSEYAFDFSDDGFSTLRNYFNYRKYVENIRKFEANKY